MKEEKEEAERAKTELDEKKYGYKSSQLKRKQTMIRSPEARKKSSYSNHIQEDKKKKKASQGSLASLEKFSVASAAKKVEKKDFIHVENSPTPSMDSNTNGLQFMQNESSQDCRYMMKLPMRNKPSVKKAMSVADNRVSLKYIQPIKRQGSNEEIDAQK